MNRLFTIMLLLAPLWSFSQLGKTVGIAPTGKYADMIETAEATQLHLSLVLPDTDVPLSELAINSLSETLNAYSINKNRLALSEQKKSPEGTFLTYKCIVGEKEVFNRFLKIFIDRQRRIREVAFIWEGADAPLQAQSLPTLEEVISKHKISGIKTSQEMLFFTGKTIESVLWLEYQHDKSIPYKTMYGVGAEIYYSKPALEFYGMTDDTTAKAKIFLPDPLTSAVVSYGGEYVDNADADNAVLTKELQTVEIKVLRVGNLYILKDPDFYFEDIEGPYGDAPMLTSPEFFYTRNQDAFEFVNVFYHLQTYRDIVHNYGYNMLPAFEIQVDAQAFHGADESAFSPFHNPPALLFGIGGIDDGEDADVIVHEFAHSLSESASPSSNNGLYRTSMEEGNADYFAMSYSRSINSFGWEKTFNWDGNAGFAGRRATTNKHYPDSFSSNKYVNAEFWVSCLSDIYAQLGASTTDKLVLGSLFTLHANKTFEQQANSLLLIDSIQNEGANSYTIHQVFVNRGIFKSNTVEEGPEKTPFKILNSYSFATGEENLTIQFSESFSGYIRIYTLDGKLIRENLVNNSDIYELPPVEYEKGLYLVRITGTSLNESFKIMRY